MKFAKTSTRHRVWNHCRREELNLLLFKRCIRITENNYWKVVMLSKFCKKLLVFLPFVQEVTKRIINSTSSWCALLHSGIISIIKRCMLFHWEHLIVSTDCDIIEKRQDEWGKTVLERIYKVFDLPTANAIYHQMCNMNFRTSRNIPLKYATLSNAK